MRKRSLRSLITKVRDFDAKIYSEFDEMAKCRDGCRFDQEKSVNYFLGGVEVDDI